MDPDRGSGVVVDAREQSGADAVVEPRHTAQADSAGREQPERRRGCQHQGRDTGPTGRESDQESVAEPVGEHPVGELRQRVVQRGLRLARLVVADEDVRVVVSPDQETAAR